MENVLTIMDLNHNLIQFLNMILIANAIRMIENVSNAMIFSNLIQEENVKLSLTDALDLKMECVLNVFQVITLIIREIVIHYQQIALQLIKTENVYFVSRDLY